MAAPVYNLSRLRSGVKPFRLHWFSRVRSTNDHAAALRERGTLYAPAVVLTGCQTVGRGRGTNRWWSQPGVVTVTFVLAIDEQIAPHQVPLLAGLAVRRAAAAFVRGGDSDVQLKWPNDLLIGGRKLAGLLCERVQRVDLIGLGLNVNVDPGAAPADVRDRMTSLSAAAGSTLDMTDVVIAVARELHATLANAGERTFAQSLREYDEHHALVGRRVTVTAAPNEPPITGTCEGLDPMGRLLLRDRRRTLHHVIAGQVDARSV